MPFVQRVVDPIYLSRQSLPREGEALLTDYELEAVTNNTLSNALRQLASLVLIANDIFDDLTKQLQDVCERSNKLRTRIELVEEKVTAFDPKTVTVPESDICTFSLRTVHFASSNALSTSLFGAETRTRALRCLYEAAAKTPVHAMRQMDRYRRDGHRSSRYFLCTPVLGGKRRRLRQRPDIDIETHTPASVVELRRWTSTEALGDMTVAPDCASRIVAEEDVPADHRLPSPEEQVQAVALRFPGEVVSVDVSGRAFQRMTAMRRSMLVGEADVRRRSSRRKPRGRRRNTIAGTDNRELREAVAGETLDESGSVEPPTALSTMDDITVSLSTSSDLLRLRTGKDDSPPDSKKSHFNSLKQWGKVKLKLMRSGSSESGSKASVSGAVSPEETNIYEAVASKGRRVEPKNSQLPISTSSAAMSMAVKLRQRQARTHKDDVLHSSSGNWSASSESGRASIGSENTATTHQPKSTTTLSSAATSSNSLNHHQAPSSSVCSRRKFLNTSTSSSVSEGTLTPDIIPDMAVPFVDDGETSSIYSCDTEGYYTSFHMDSGLKTLKEEDMSAPQTPLHSTTALSNSPGRSSSALTTLTAENEYELFGKGSTSTTTSSAGTVCTTLRMGHNDSNLSLALAPAVPERKSSLERSNQRVVAMIHKQEASDSPDSGHNTSSSPVDSTNSPQGTLTGRSSEYEFSESDLEGVDRLERIRVKTTINSSRIPSMCVITPPVSDDEASLSHYVPSYTSKTTVPSTTTRDTNNMLETEFGLKNRHNLKLVMPQQITGMTQDYHTSQPRPLQKQISTDSERSSENETVKTAHNTPTHVSTSNTKNTTKTKESNVGSSSDFTSVKVPNEGSTKSGTSSHAESGKPSIHKSSLHPFNNMIDKVKGVLSSTSSKKHLGSKLVEARKISPSEEKPIVDPGDYVTIADVRGRRSSGQTQVESPHYSRPVRDAEYVSLNELPMLHTSSPPANPLSSPSPSNSLERCRRQGARVTLDAEGKVVYSSDSLKRNKGAHTTFEPGPYVKEQALTPTASPLPAHRAPKSNIRPVALSSQGRSAPTSSIPPSPTSLSPTRNKPTSPTSPQLGKVIIRAGSKTAPMSRVASPTSIGVPIVASPSGRPMSPQSARGAYVHMQTPEESQRRRCVSPGRSSATEDDEEGKSSSYMHPPRYISPPSVRSPVRNGPMQESPTTFYTLPARRTQEKVSVANVHSPQELNRSGSGRFNTIASGENWSQSNFAPYDTRTRSAFVNGIPTSLGAYKSSHTPMMHPSSSSVNTVHWSQRPREGMLSPQEQVRQYCSPMPATIPTVPKNNVAYLKQNSVNRHGFHSSTPTKNQTLNMNMSANFSPIKNYSGQKDEVRSQQTSSPRSQNAALLQHQTQQQTHQRGRKQSNDPVKRQEAARLLSPPKSSMTAEELFAAIHKSKKKLNIKTDSDSYSRSASPSCSSMTSLSPGSSESSINGGRTTVPAKNGPETGSLAGENVGRNRHSWSPNSNEYLDVRGNLETRTPSPMAQVGTRQSWACDRLGPIQQTSRNDFKRLLLQHGAKSNPSSNPGSPVGKISAVEQLKITRQQKLMTPPSSIVANGGYLPRSPADKRTNGSKLLQSPRSVATWRFASPRTDVLSSTILEDCAEEEKASSSPQESNPRADAKLPPTTGSSHGQTLINASVRRPLNLSFGDTDRESPRKETLRQTEISSILQQYHGETSPKTRLQHVQKQSGSKILAPEEKTVSNVNSNSSIHSNRTLSQELLSPSNVKENVNTNQQLYNSYTNSPSKTNVSSSPNTQMTNSQLNSFKARQLFMQQPSALSNQQRTTLQPSSPRIQVSLDKQRSNFYNSHGSPGRSILGTIETKSPSKSALETAL